jgi:hypothetical protein
MSQYSDRCGSQQVRQEKVDKVCLLSLLFSTRALSRPPYSHPVLDRSTYSIFFSLVPCKSRPVDTGHKARRGVSQWQTVTLELSPHDNIPFFKRYRVAAGIARALHDSLSMHDFSFIHDYRLPRDPSYYKILPSFTWSHDSDTGHKGLMPGVTPPKSGHNARYGGSRWAAFRPWSALYYGCRLS